jgi:exosome complex component RRP43
MAATTEDDDNLRASTFQRLHPRAYYERFVSENIRPDGRSFDGWRDVSLNVGARSFPTSLTRHAYPSSLGSISTADGSALIRLGNTTIVCGVKAEIAEPELDSSQDGFLGTFSQRTISLKTALIRDGRDLVPNLDLPALCSPKFKPGPPGEDAQVLSDKLNEALTTYVEPCSQSDVFSCSILMLEPSSGVLPLSSLCIHPGKAVWVLYVDAICINYDGNAFDATLIAMIAALKNSESHLFALPDF